MIVKDVDIQVTVAGTEAFLVLHHEDKLVADIAFNLSQIEEFQGRLAIAAAKLRGKFAKEATNA
jgi:hypothetical protein